MKIKENVTLYICEHCGKEYKQKHWCEKHEEKCFHNPDNERACFNCTYLVKKDTKVYSGIDNYFTSEPIYELKSLFFCEKKEIFLYPPISEHKGNAYDEFHNDEINNFPMLKLCDEQNMIN